jgi:hypothetical protein
MNHPCPSHVFCPNTLPSDLEFDSPLANFTSQQPDPNLFFGINFGWDNNLPNLGDSFTETQPGFCESLVSQDAADICAAQQQFTGTTGGANGGDVWRNPDQTQVQLVGCDFTQCSYTCPDGLMFTWTILAGAVVSWNKILANRIANSLACNYARLRHVCLPSLAGACLGQPYQGIIVPTGASPFTFSITSGSLPPGLSLNQTSPNSAVITGTPTQAGNFPFTVQATDNFGNFMTKQYVLPVLSMNTPAQAGQGAAYAFQFTVAGGTAPYTFAIVSGTLPAGLSMSSAGVVSGTPTTIGASTVLVSVADSSGNSCSFFETFNVVLTGFQICNWATLLSKMTVPVTWPAHGPPEWNGVFNLKSFFQAPGFTNDPIWYFTGQSISGKSVSADASPLYPNGDWQDDPGTSFTSLEFDHLTGQWFLFLQSSNPADANVGTWIMTNNDPTNPAGVYTLSAAPGFTTPPNIITVQKVGAVCCPNWSALQWTAPVLTPGNGGGTCSASASGNTATIAGTGGGASCSQVTGLTGTVGYTGPDFDAFITLNVTNFTPNGQEDGGSFDILQDAGFLARVRIGDLFGGNKMHIEDADGTRDINGAMPGTFTIHIHGVTTAGSVIKFQTTGSEIFASWVFACVGPSTLNYNLSVSC